MIVIVATIAVIVRSNYNQELEDNQELENNYNLDNQELDRILSGGDDSLKILLMLWILGFFEDPNTKKLTDEHTQVNILL
ncbi:unnamed protein product [Rhizophagus irregularis]|nr:unnamed protein product [Rhizophagus irregularis]